jgi:hypothetical protein
MKVTNQHDTHGQSNKKKNDSTTDELMNQVAQEMHL